MLIKTDRSRIETYQRCPRRRWIEYEKDRGGSDNVVGGYVANRPQFALETGSGFHKGMEVVLRNRTLGGIMDMGDAIFIKNVLPEAVDRAVVAGVAEYEKEILPYFDQLTTKSSFTDDENNPDSEDDEPFTPYMVGEGRALVEGLIRGYCAADSGLKLLLAEYEIVEVEQEIDVPLDKRECSSCGGSGVMDAVGTDEGVPCNTCFGRGWICDVILMARPDGILRSRSDNQLYVLSFKTASTLDRRKLRNADYDTQGISELIAAEHKYNEKFAGVQMVYAIKGYKSQDKSDGIWKHNNGIIRPYVQRGINEDQYGFAYEYMNTMGENKRVGKGWNKTNLWEEGDGAIKEWIETLISSDEPNCNPDWLDKMFATPEPQFRNEQDMEEWKDSVAAQERKIATIAEIINSDGGTNLGKGLMRDDFPKYRHSCTYPTPCPYIPICHEGMDVHNGSYKPRESNHPQEKES